MADAKLFSEHELSFVVCPRSSSQILAHPVLPYSSEQGPGAASRAPTSRPEGQVVCKEEDRLEEDCREHDDGERQ
jgi:hypothetical protein